MIDHGGDKGIRREDRESLAHYTLKIPPQYDRTTRGSRATKQSYYI